ncbi:MAG: M1 family metallopeptidase [Flavobacteriaceae bacterium]|nr:M1 family metallopeptidase [Flavobacteriaceae bacterium]
MKKIAYLSLALVFITATLFAQEQKPDKKGHYNISKFRQLKNELATPNMFRTASGAPGPAYYQQQADYKMDIVLDDKTQKLSGEETITYFNNSPDVLTYLWVQLDQNMRAPNSKTPDIQAGGPGFGYKPKQYIENFMGKPFQGGFHIDYVKDTNGNAIKYTINRTMMRIDIPTPMQPNSSYSFKIKWWYNINNHVAKRGRSGFEHFEKDGNNLYIIAQFFPRMAVYNDVEGWQNMQFWGRGEFALTFGNYTVNITTPADHILDGTGVMLNRKDMFTKKQWKRYQKATKSFDEPVVIVTQEEAEEAETKFSNKTKTWQMHATNVRDFAFTSSRKFIFDAMAVKIGDRTVMAESLYPKEGNPLWGAYSTKVVANTLKIYSKHLFDYPYHKAISVHSKRQGMEYPMICWNYGRPNPDGTYSQRTKNGMIGVITHEVGHNWFPMIVNSDERQWTWMDEGLNSFTEMLAEAAFEKDFPSRGFPKNITSYMDGDQSKIAPIMSQSNNIYQFGSNAYAKPAASLYILRELILGHDLFDKAFKTYAQRWKFKHPSPADFFRTMEDASATDLDWFWRGWYYTTDYNDIGIKNVSKYVVSTTPNKRAKFIAKRYGIDLKNYVFLVDTESDEYSPEMEKIKQPTKELKILDDYLTKNFTTAERKALKNSKYFYKVTFDKPGGLVMPIVIRITYDDGSIENKYYPAQIWRFNDKEVTKMLASDKAIKSIVLDPDLLTADVNLKNNSWPKKVEESKFDKFKKKIKE